MAMAMMTKVEHVLDVLVDEVPGYLQAQGLAAWTCIASTRIACLALAEVGIKASPLPVHAYAFSGPYMDAVKAGVLGPEGSPTPEQVEALKKAGAHVVAIGKAPEGIEQRSPSGRPGWPGHLVALVERRWVVDLTAHQMARPAKGIHVHPHRFRVTPEFMAGDTETLMFGESPVAYVRTDDNTFVVTSDWTGVRRGDPLVRGVTSILRKH